MTWTNGKYNTIPPFGFFLLLIILAILVAIFS